jgi:aspartate 1-decarboxylase
MPLIEILKSKIHRASVTQAELNYVGSITIDVDLLERSQIREYEKVQVVNINNGERFETYTINGPRGSGVICINGAAARKCVVGDLIIIITYMQIEITSKETFEPIVVFVDENNRIKNL